MAGKVTFLATENFYLLAESKRRMIEEKLSEAWQMAKDLGIKPEELYLMMDILFKEDEDE